MKLKTRKKLYRWSLVFAGTAMFGLLPGGCEVFILRAVSPLFIR